jgi:hypothetical protein
MPTHRLGYHEEGVTGRESADRIAFYRPQSKREEEILERARVCHRRDYARTADYRDAIMALERLFRVERASAHDAQSIIVAEQSAQVSR